MQGRELIVSRAARFFRDGDLVNLGIGMPTQVANYLPDGRGNPAPVGERLHRHRPHPHRRGLGPRRGQRRRPARLHRSRAAAPLTAA